MSRPTPTVADWERELARALQDTTSPDGMTTDELSAALGRSTVWIIRHLLRPAAAAGRLVVRKRRDMNFNGRMTIFTVYSIQHPSPSKPHRSTP